MEASDIIQQAIAAGAVLKVVDGRLKGKNLKKLDANFRAALRGRKEEITNLLVEQNSAPLVDELIEIVPELKPCPLCRGRDFIHGYYGGYFCAVCQPNVRRGAPVKAAGYRTISAYIEEGIVC